MTTTSTNGARSGAHRLASFLLLAPLLTTLPGAARADALPSPPAASGHAAAIEANKRGSKAMDQQNLTLAIRELEAATRADAGYALAWINLGWARFLTHDPDQLAQAEKDTRQGVTLATTPAEKGAGCYNLGRIIEARGDTKGAVAQYQASLAARAGNKPTQAALDRAQALGLFAGAAGVALGEPGVTVTVEGPIPFSPRVGGPSLRAGVVIRHPAVADSMDRYQFTVVVVDGKDQLAGKLALAPTEINTEAERGSAGAALSTLALANGTTLLRAEKRETRADQGSGKWPDGHYDHTTLLVLDGNQLRPVLSRATRFERSVAAEGEASAYRIALKVAGSDLVIDEAEVRKKGKAGKQTITCKWTGGAFACDKKSLVPGDG